MAGMQAPKDEGSPVDVAKSYMRARPPWASPSIDHTKSPTLAGIQLFKEETPHLFGGNSMPSSKVPFDELFLKSCFYRFNTSFIMSLFCLQTGVLLWFSISYFFIFHYLFSYLIRSRSLALL